VGYSDNNDNTGAAHTCVEGILGGALLVCTPDDCSATVPTGAGYGTECDELVTDDTCTQTCTTGYSDNNNGDGQDYTCSAGEFVGTLLECTPDSCADLVPTGAGYGTECDTLVTDGTCTQTCTAGYSDNNSDNGQEYTCFDGVLDGTLLVCTPDDCSATVPTGAGYGTECDELVTDDTCTQMCTIGYSNVGGDGSMSCPAGELDDEQQIVCIPDACNTVPITDAGFGMECDSLVTDAICTQTCDIGYTNVAYECDDTDNGAMDRTGEDDCADYVAHPDWCGGYDDDDFQSEYMCCACGGGAEAFNGDMSCPNGLLDVTNEIKCIVNTCSNAPSAPEFGDISFSSGNDHASVASFMCNAGYTMLGNAELICDAASDGIAWPSGTTECEVNTCIEPPSAPDGGTVTFSEGDDHDSVATFDCDPGYSQSGDTSTTCDATVDQQNWPDFEDIPTCTAIICAMNEHVDNHVCVPCPEGELNTAGDDSSGANTVCQGMLTDDLMVWISLQDVFNFTEDDETALYAAISSTFEQQGVVAEVSMDNSTMVWNATTGDFTAMFTIDVQSESDGDPAEAVATNYLETEEFTDALNAAFEEADLGFAINADDVALVPEAITAAPDEPTSPETVAMIVLIVVVVVMALILLQQLCCKDEKRLPRADAVGRMHSLGNNYAPANTASTVELGENSSLTGGSSSKAALTSQNSFQM
jgi:hypothetical protein